MPVDESFTGQTTDPGLGLIDYNARHYDPQLGRFIQADPVLAGLNRYSYVWNNPLRYTDPTGNEPCPKSGCTVQTHTYGTVQAWNRTITQPTSGNGSGASAAAEHSARILAAIADTGYRPDPQDIRDAQDGALIVGSGFPVLGEFIDAAACGSGFGWNLETAADCGGLAIPFVGGRAIRRITGIAPNPARFCSFSGETEVLMADGTTKPISEIEIGDFVLAEDPETGERGARQVTQLWVHEDSLVDLEINGHDIATTEDHPFWNHTDGEWQRADALDRGDLLLTADGELLVVDGLDWGSARTTTAYNLTVDDIHTYYVRIGERDVLVHNQCGELLSKPSQIAERLGVSPREVNDAIHALKPNIPSGGPVKNPDVVVDVVSGEVFPQIPGGGLGDSIGNIFDVLPGGN